MRKPLELGSEARGLEAARLALTPPAGKRLPSWIVLLCAVVMAGAALTLAAVVVLGGWDPQRGSGETAVRGAIAPR